MSEAPAQRKYAAFVSYRHADNREPGRRWAEWIHQQLETYEVPRELVGTQNQRGEQIPASLYPVFRDEEELPADADLSQGIRRALEGSAVLVVLCSPRACQSRFVDDEIRTFKELGRSDRVLALLIDGEPNVDDAGPGAPGVRPATECLPHALRFGVPGPDGRVDWSQRAEPIAADARPGGLPEQGYTSAGAYGEAQKRAGGLGGRELHARTRAYAARLDLARLKVIAGVLGLPLGTLRARDAAYRVQRFRRLALTLGSLALVALVAALVAVWQGQRAQQNFERAESARQAQARQLTEASRYAHASAERALRAGRWREGVALLGRALHYQRENRAAAAHLWSALVYGQGDRDEAPVAVWSFGAPLEALAVAEDGRHLAGVTNTSALVVRDLLDGTERRAALPKAEYPGRLRVARDGSAALVERGALAWYLVRWPPPDGAVEVVTVPGTYHDCRFAPEGRDLVALGPRRGLQRLDGTTGRPLAPDTAASERWVAGSLSGDGARLLVQELGSLRLRLKSTDGTVDVTPAGPPTDQPLFALDLGPRGEFLALLGSGQLGVWGLTAGERVVAPRAGVGLWRAFAFAPDGAACVVDAAEGTLEVHTLPGGAPRRPLLHHPTQDLRATFSPDGRRVFTAGTDGAVAAWPCPSTAPGSAPLLTPRPSLHAAWIDATQAALATADAVEVWDVPARRVAAVLDTGPAPGGLALVPQGPWLAVGGPGGRIGIWDPTSGTRLREIQGLPLDIYTLRAAPRGSRLLVSGWDLANGQMEQRARVVDTTTGAPVGPDVTPERASALLGLSADGERLVAVYGRLAPSRGWHVRDGSPLPAVAPADEAHVLGGDERAGIGTLGQSPSARDDDARSVLDEATRLPASEPLGPPRSRAFWSPDGATALVLTAAGVAALYETPRPAPPGPWLDDWVAAASGLALAESGQGRELAPQERLDARARLAGARPDDPTWERLRVWWLTPPDGRPAGP